MVCTGGETMRDINLSAVQYMFINAKVRGFRAEFAQLNSEMLLQLECPPLGEQQRVRFPCQL